MAKHLSKTAMELEDELTKKLIQLDAMLDMTWGEQGESFRCLSDENQGNFMWACSDVASEVRRLASQLSGALREEVSHG
ncbi:MAG: hypothetical protein QM750_11865 [Rubrivivax sp.]